MNFLNFFSNKCRAKGCKEQHQRHYCRNCRNADSDHISSNCKAKSTYSNENFYKKQGCKAVGCKQQHTEHYCKVCHNQNSNHLATGCPYGIVLYHGTTYEAATSIKKTGFRPSTDGCLGKGVYFTPSWEDVVKIAKRWGAEAAVIQCKLDPDSNYVQDQMHIPWTGVTNGQFKQYVVREQYIKRIKIVKIHRV